MDTESKNQSTITCKKCGAAFTCGMEAGSGHCWCHDMPHVVQISEDAQTAEDCLCPACLEKLIAESR